MPEFRKSFFDTSSEVDNLSPATSTDTSSKIDNLATAKDTKLQNLGSGKDEVVWETKRLTALYDVDSPRFEDVMGGVGGTEKDGTVYDTSKEFSGDRIKGIDSYEVFPTDERTLDYFNNDPRGIAKLAKQRTRLATERNVDYSTITNEDVFEQGAIGTVKELAMLQAYSMGDADYLEQVKAWNPDAEMSKKWRTGPIGIDVASLNIDVERAFSGEYAFRGRPLSQVRGIGSKQLIGEHSGYKYGEPSTYTKPQINVDDVQQSYLKSEAEDMDIWDRLGNSVDAFQRTFAKEIGLDLSDLVGEGVSYLTDDKYGWDHGTEEEKTQVVNDYFGFNPYAAEGDYAKAKVYADNITAAMFDENKDVDFDDVYELVKVGVTTPEMFADSAAFMASFFIPILGWGGKGAKGAKAIKSITAGKKAGVITEDVAKSLIQIEKANIHVLNKLRTFTQSNAGLLQVSANNVNDQIDEYKEIHGSSPSVYKVGQMFATESLLLGLDRWADLSILKSPAALKGVRDAFSVLTPQGKAKVLAKTVGIAGGLAVNMGKEAAQEYTQEIGQEFNVQFNFDDNGGFLSATAMDEAKTVLLDQKTQAIGIMGAGLGAGGAVQFAGVGALGNVTGVTGRLVGEKIKTQKKSDPTDLPKTNVTEEDVSPEDLNTRSATATSEAEATISKYSNMVNDEEFTKIFAASSLEDEEFTETPDFKAKLKSNPSEYRSSITEIEKAESVLQARQDVGTPKETDTIAFKLLRKAKREVYKNLIEDEGYPTLGSGYSEEDVIEGYLETVDVVDGKIQLSTTEEEALAAYAKLHDIPPLRFENLRKFRTDEIDAAAVYQESVGTGSRSASSYKIALRNLVNTPNASRTAVAEVVDKIDNFINSQETKKANYETAVAPLAADIATFNKSIEKGGPLNIAQKTTKGKLKQGHQFIGSKQFIAVTENSEGKLVIHPESLAIIESAKDTIGYLTRVKNRYAPQTKAILGDNFAGSTDGIIVKPSATHQKDRDKDTTRFAKQGVTKAIVDTKKNAQSPVWNSTGDYGSANASRINTGEYTADDVIVIHSTAKGYAKDSNIRKEIKAAKKAGAAIIIDSATKHPGVLVTLLNQSGYLKVEKPAGVSYLPADKAAPFIEERRKKVKTKRTKDITLRELTKAFTLRDSLDGKSFEQAVKDKVISQAKADSYTKALSEAEPLFAGGLPKMEEYYQNIVNTKIENTTKRLNDIARTYGFESAELGEAMAEVTAASAKGTVPSSVATVSIEAVNATIKGLSEGELLLSRWNEAEKAAKKGELDIDKWITENVPSAKKQAEALLNNAIGKGRNKVYAWFDKDTSKWEVKSKKANVPENVMYQVIEQDPSTYVVVSKATPLNSYNAKELRIAGHENIAFNQLVVMAVKLLTKAIRAPNVVLGNTTNGITETANSPAGTLIFDKEGKANENVAITASVALHNFIRHSAYLLSKGKKSKKDISEILGIDESQLNQPAVDMMSDKGLLYKTAANSIGKDMAAMLGLARKSDSEIDAQNYDALLADLGQTAILMGIEQGLLEKDDTLGAAEFAKVVLRKDEQSIDRSGSAKVTFIQAVAGQEENIEHIAIEAKEISEGIPNVDVSRKDPSFTPISKKTKARRAGKIHKDRLGGAIPSSSVTTMYEMMNTPWTADLDAMSKIVSYSEDIKVRLGYIAIDSDQYNELSFNEKEVQESINRSIEKPLEELALLVKSYDGKSEVSMWFERFFSRNGRHFIDSNTINPHTDKHLARFSTQPTSHTQTYVRKGDTFTVEGKDQTFNVHYALAQAFGFAVDKKSTPRIVSYGETVLKNLNTPELINTAREAFLSTGKFAFSTNEDHEIEVEHLGHALQAFTFLEDSIASKGKPFTSAITAEFDAVTSGFGIKLLQMPIIANGFTWLKKVGVFLNTDEELAKGTPVSMNDMLDTGGVQDAYKELAIGVKVLSFKEMSKSLAKDTVVSRSAEYSKNLWGALSDVLPKAVDGKVSSELRNLFKYPFLTFNYAASLKTIRENLLTGELLNSISKDMAAADITDTESKIVKLMQAFVGPRGDLGALQAKVRTKPLSMVKSSKTSNSNIQEHLGQMIEASYGAQVEEILTEQFGPFIEAQKKVNNAFKAMFEVFSVSFDIELEKARKSGAVSVEKERSIYEKLMDQWPMIKGPLSDMEADLDVRDGIGIYDSQTASPTGIHSTHKPAVANLSPELRKQLGQKTVRVSHMIKQLSAAIASGSVIPIHYIDGAMLGSSINNLADAGIKGVTDVFDAKMVPLSNMGRGQQEYNKEFVEINANYSFIDAIMVSLDSFIDKTPLSDKKYTDRRVTVGKSDVTVRDFLLTTRNEFADLTNKVNKGRKDLFDTLNKGAKIMHMAGTADGVYDVLPASIDYKPVAEYQRRTYTSDVTYENQDINDLNLKAINLKC